MKIMVRADGNGFRLVNVSGEVRATALRKNRGTLWRIHEMPVRPGGTARLVATVSGKQPEDRQKAIVHGILERIKEQYT
jgi:hypothetical protein